MITKLKEISEKIKKEIPILLFALKEKDTPFLAKAFAILTVCYALSPIDLIPDFIPILGYLDDLIIIPFLIFITIKLIPKSILDNIGKSQGIEQSLIEKKWYYSIPILIIYLMIIFFVLKAFNIIKFSF